MVVMIQRTDNSAADDDYSLVTARRYNYPSSYLSMYSGSPERSLATLSDLRERHSEAWCSKSLGFSGRILNQMAYMAGRNTSVIIVPPSVPPIRV